MATGRRLHGTLAAAVTPLRDGGARLDEAAVEPLAALLRSGGADGVLVAGTTGEGVLLSVAERRALCERWVAAAGGDLVVCAHVGAQTTADAVALAEHAAQAGAGAVAVIGPGYFPLDDEALEAHFTAVARAAGGLPVYLYEFAARTGYALAPALVGRLRDALPAIAGLKVSDSPFSAVAPYLLDGLDVFVGSEPALVEALAAGAVGAVSGLAGAFPDEVAAVVRAPSPEGARRMAALKGALAPFGAAAALKHVLGRRGVPVGPDVRGPLRPLRDDERRALDAVLDDLGA